VPEARRAREDFLRLEHKCTACGARAAVTVTGANCELKVEEIAEYRHQLDRARRFLS
jgi:hypothetical protein